MGRHYLVILILVSFTAKAQVLAPKVDYPLNGAIGKFGIDMVTKINNRDTMRGDAFVRDNSLRLDGTGDFISIVHNGRHTITDRFTISFWFKPDNLTQSSKHLISKVNTTFTDNNYAILWEYVNNQIEFYAGGYTGTNPRTGTGMTISNAYIWTFVCYTYNGATMTGYLNNVQRIQVSTTFSLATNGSYLSIGGNYQFGNQVAGRIRDFRLWDRGLTYSEVLAEYLRTVNKSGVVK